MADVEHGATTACSRVRAGVDNPPRRYSSLSLAKAFEPVPVWRTGLSIRNNGRLPETPSLGGTPDKVCSEFRISRVRPASLRGTKLHEDVRWSLSQLVC